MKIIELSMQHLNLAKAEAEAVCHFQGTLHDHYLVLESGIKNLHHILGYAKEVGEFGFLLNQVITLQDITCLIRGETFGFRFGRIDPATKQHLLLLAKSIKQQADLSRPDTLLLFRRITTGILCIVNPQENTQHYERRRAHLLAAPHPAMMHPRLARACVNLTGIRKGTLLDPFCGAGGILIEAALRGLRPVGVDLSLAMIQRAKTNLEQFGLSAQLIHGNALSLKKKYSYIVTDLPYGKTTSVSTPDVITQFFERLPALLGKRAVVGIPSYPQRDTIRELDPVLKKIRMSVRLTHVFDYYLHRTLSKKILVLERVRH